MSMSRRAFLQTSAGGSALLIAAAAGFAPRIGLAATEPAGPLDPRKPFQGHALDEVIKALGGSDAQPSTEIALQAPEIAENGAVVPLVIESKLPGTRMIAIVSEKNPHALSAVFNIPDGAEAYVMTRVKIAETSRVTAIVQTDKGFFYTDQLVKVTLGGCGG